jgi:ribonuclease R
LHFTSPIRRYPDIEVHRAVKRLLHGEKPETSASAIEALRASATAASSRERSAVDVEREVVDLYRALYARGLLGEEFEGTVTSVVGSGLYVTLDEPFVDVLVRFESMGSDRYEMTEHELGVVGVRSGERIMIGDRIFVTIEDVAILRRTVYARRVAPAATFAEPRKGRKREAAPHQRGKREHSKPREGASEKPGRFGKKRTARAPSTRGKRRR